MSRHGATYLGNGRTRFSLWAPRASSVGLVLGDGPTPLGTLAGVGDGWFEATVDGTQPGTRDRYLLDGAGPYADPASRWQPDGVHGPSAVVATRQHHSDGSHVSQRFRGVPLGAQVICELHVGTFSKAGTFAGVIEGLGELARAGYTAIECMPVGEFPGARNWGYDGVFPSAVQSSYGGPDGLAALVAAAHELGLAVILDVVYNHFGPKGAVHEHFGPYLTDRYATPWGPAVNVDGPGSDEVRSYFIESACYYVGELGIDGLRLDAIHAIADPTASPFVAELAAAVHATGRATGRTITVVAESAANDPRTVAVPEYGGIGCDGVWNDDFHHALRVCLDGSKDRWFADYHGLSDLAIALTNGFVLEHRRSLTYGRRHGARAPGGIPGERLVVFAQNHDQIGNAGYGARLATSLPLEAQYPIAATVLLAPFVPLRFMGEEYGEVAPFHFFTSFEDPELADAVRRGREDEIGGATGQLPPDPEAYSTFAKSRPDRSLAREPAHLALFNWQRELLALRASQPALGSLEPRDATVAIDEAHDLLVLVRRADGYLDAPVVAIVCRFSGSGPELAWRLDDVALEGGRFELVAGHGATLAPDACTLLLERYAAAVLVEARAEHGLDEDAVDAPSEAVSASPT